MDADALQLSIEDEEKLLNEEVCAMDFMFLCTCLVTVTESPLR